MRRGHVPTGDVAGPTDRNTLLFGALASFALGLLTLLAVIALLSRRGDHELVWGALAIPVVLLLAAGVLGYRLWRDPYEPDVERGRADGPSSRATKWRRSFAGERTPKKEAARRRLLTGQTEVPCEARPRHSRLQGSFLRRCELGATRLVRRGLCWLAVGISGHVGSIGRWRWIVGHRSRLFGLVGRLWLLSSALHRH